MINIKIGIDGIPDQQQIELGNQYENIDETIVFDLPEEYSNHKTYIIAVNKKDSTTVILPFTDNTFKVSSKITHKYGIWYIYVMMREQEIDTSVKEVDISAKDNEHVFISDGIIGVVKKTYIDSDLVSNITLDTNLQIIYDELVTLKQQLLDIIGGNEDNPISSGCKVANIVNEQSTYTCDMAFDEIKEIIQDGGTVVACWNNFYYQLKEVGFDNSIPANNFIKFGHTYLEGLSQNAMGNLNFIYYGDGELTYTDERQELIDAMYVVNVTTEDEVLYECDTTGEDILKAIFKNEIPVIHYNNDWYYLQNRPVAGGGRYYFTRLEVANNKIDYDEFSIIYQSSLVTRNQFTINLNDYTVLINKPMIGGVELTGNKTLEDLGIQPKGNYLTEIPEEYVNNTELAELLEFYVKNSDLSVKLNKYVSEEDLESKGYLTSKSLTDLQNAIDKKLNKNLGIENANKFLMIGADGIITPVEAYTKADVDSLLQNINIEIQQIKDSISNNGDETV